MPGAIRNDATRRVCRQSMLKNPRKATNPGKVGVHRLHYHRLGRKTQLLCLGLSLFCR